MNNNLKKFFTDMIEDALKNDNMMIVNMVFVSFISADNNITDKQIKENCESLIELIEVLNNYPNNTSLQKIKDMAIKYNEKYYNF
jgi:CO dehydrogenase/acetyl-CoA synthase delta subunit